MGTTYKVVLINYDDSEAEKNVFNVSGIFWQITP